MALFPDVPIAPGVPPVPRDPFAAAADIVLLTEDAISLFAGAFGPQWGLFQDGFPVVTNDSVVAFEFKQEWVVADYPLEAGAFESYDKVATPFDVRLRFSAGATEEVRQALIESVDAIAGTTDLYDAVTPEKIYQNVNVVHQSYRRTATNGVGLIVIDIWLREIRLSASETLDSTQSPSASDAVNDGTVQAAPANTTQSQAVQYIN